MSMKSIQVKGAREHNLKNIDIEIPRDQLVVITGLSGSGKSSLAFDTIYAEGQRRYVESLSSYARQFLGQMEKPDVDYIDGLSPAISIDQKTTSKNPRSTVGTVTEIYDYLRLLYARIGIPHCPVCGREIKQQTIDQIVDQVMTLGERTKIQVLAPVVREDQIIFFNGAAGKHAVFVEQEQLHEHDFLLSQSYGLSVQRNGSCKRIKAHCAVDKLRRGHAVSATHESTQTRRHFVQIKGLAEIVVRAEVESFHALTDGVPGGEHEHRHVLSRGAPRFQNVEPVHAGEPEIENDGVVFRRCESLHAERTFLEPVHGKAHGGQAHFESVAYENVILDEKNAHGAPLCSGAFQGSRTRRTMLTSSRRS